VRGIDGGPGRPPAGVLVDEPPAGAQARGHLSDRYPPSGGTAPWRWSCPTARRAGHIQAKTGTLAAGDELNQRLILPSKALGGYIDTSNGKLLAFYLVVNNVPATSINDVLVVNNDLGKIAARLWGPKG